MKLKLLVLIIVLIIVVSSVSWLIYAIYMQVKRGVTAGTLSSASPTSATPAVTQTQLLEPLKLSERARAFLKQRCGIDKDVLILIYLKHMPNATLATRFFEIPFERFVEDRSGGKLKVDFKLCYVQLDDFAPYFNIDYRNYTVFPLIAIASEAASRIEILRNFSINIDGILLLNSEAQRSILAQLSGLGDEIPIETNRMPSIDPVETPIIGSRDANIYIFIYEDFYCPWCARFYVKTIPKLRDLLDRGEIAFVHKNLIVHPEVKDMHKYLVAMYIEKQNGTQVLSLLSNVYTRLLNILTKYSSDVRKAWEIVYKEINVSFVRSLAEEICRCTIDITKYGDKLSEIISKDTDEAILYAITGTPGFVVWNRAEGYGIVFDGFRTDEDMFKVLEMLKS